jgi:tRNA A-37 threonylcarbamoyl transferase component Bud32
MTEPIMLGHFYRSKFRALRQVARGGTADVYLLEDSLLKRLIALKRARLDGAVAEATLRALFDNEARILGKLAGQFAPDLHEYDPAVPELFLRYVEGYTLDRYLEGWLKSPERFPTDLQLVQLGRQIHEATTHCHRQGVLLADLKPMNVMVSAGAQPGQLVVTLIDFGCSRVENAPDQPDEGAYSQGYGAPELLRREKPDRAADVYSLGAILYALLRRREPDLHNPPRDFGERRSQVLPSLQKLIREMTAEAPDKRPTLDAVGQALERCEAELVDQMQDTGARCPHCNTPVRVRGASHCQACGKPLRRITRILKEDQPDGTADLVAKMYEAEQAGNLMDALYWARQAHAGNRLTPTACVRAVEIALNVEGEMAFAREVLGVALKAVNSLPDDARRRFLIALGTYLQRTKQPLADHLAWFEDGARRWPGEEALWVLWCQASPKDAREAILQAGLRQHPRSAALNYHLGLALYERGAEMEALEAWLRAIECGDRRLRFLRGVLQLATALNDQARMQFLRNLLSGHDPVNAEECLELIAVALEARDATRVLELAERGLKDAPFDVRLREAKARGLFEQRKYELLLEFLREGTATAAMRSMQGQALYQLRDYGRAVRVLDEVVRQGGTAIDCFYLVRCHQQLEQIEQARAVLRACRRRFPDDENLCRLAQRIG